MIVEQLKAMTPEQWYGLPANVRRELNIRIKLACRIRRLV